MLSGNVLAHFSGKTVVINGKPQSLTSYNVEFITTLGSIEYFAVRAVASDHGAVCFAVECKNSAVQKAVLLDPEPDEKKCDEKKLLKGHLCLGTCIANEPEVEFA